MARLDEIAELIQGQTLSTLRPRGVEDEGITISVISTANLGLLLPVGPFKQARLRAASAQRYALQTADVLIPQNRRPVEATVVDEAHTGFIVGPNVAVIRLQDSSLDAYVLAALLASASYQPVIEQSSAGKAAKHISLSHLGDLPIPEVDEVLQQQIRDFLLLGHELESEMKAWRRAMDNLIDRIFERRAGVRANG